MRLLSSILLSVFFCGPAAFAAAGSNVGFISSLGLSAGAASTVNKDKSIPKIDLLYTEVLGDMGYNFSYVAPTLQAAYRYLGQRTDPDTVNSINVSGMGYLVGGGLTFVYMRYNLSAIYDFMGSFDLAKKSGGGDKVTYSDASGFHVTARYRWSPHMDISLNFSMVDYKKKTSGATVTELDDNPVSQTTYGLGLAYRF